MTRDSKRRKTKRDSDGGSSRGPSRDKARGRARDKSRIRESERASEKASNRDRPDLVVGWRESVALPDWRIRSVKAKVDTGARTSALHVEDVEELSGERVRFRVVRHRGDETPLAVTTGIHRLSRVKPSSGSVEDRYVIKTKIRIGPLERVVEVSLVSREKMLCRMLVGRNALPDGTVVDPHSRYLHGRPKRRKRKAKQSSRAKISKKKRAKKKPIKKLRTKKSRTKKARISRRRAES